MPGPTGDIKWTWTDPKTVELSNEPPPLPRDDLEFGQATALIAAGMSPEQAMDHLRAMTGKQMTQKELENAGLATAKRSLRRETAEEIRQGSREMLRTNRKINRTREARQDRAMWRNQLRGFQGYLEGGGPNIRGGIQELVESGAIWINDDGTIRTSVPYRGDLDQLRDAVGLWNDFQNDLAGEIAKRPGMTDQEREKLFHDMLLEREPGT